MAVDLRATADGDGALLETETRIYLTDAAARRRFGAYWLVDPPLQRPDPQTLASRGQRCARALTASFRASAAVASVGWQRVAQPIAARTSPSRSSTAGHRDDVSGGAARARDAHDAEDVSGGVRRRLSRRPRHPWHGAGVAPRVAARGSPRTSAGAARAAAPGRSRSTPDSARAADLLRSGAGPGRGAGGPPSEQRRVFVLRELGGLSTTRSPKRSARRSGRSRCCSSARAARCVKARPAGRRAGATGGLVPVPGWLTSPSLASRSRR